MSTPRPTETDEAVARDHYRQNRPAIMAAAGAIVRRWRLDDTVAVGMDHTADNPLAAWWAKVHVPGGRAPQLIVAEGHGSALQALEALDRQIAVLARQRRRR